MAIRSYSTALTPCVEVFCCPLTQTTFDKFKFERLPAAAKSVLTKSMRWKILEKQTRNWQGNC